MASTFFQYSKKRDSNAGYPVIVAHETKGLPMTRMSHSSGTISHGINPHASRPTSLLALGRSLWLNRQIITQMTKREVMGRYKGSIMGLAWSFFNPVFMLAVYTFVFSVIF